MGLSNLAVEKTPPEQLSVYLGEATKCYVLGLPQAAVALCRAALEQGIREILRKDGADSSGDLSELLETASGAKVLNSAILRFAEDVRRAANRVCILVP